MLALVDVQTPNCSSAVTSVIWIKKNDNYDLKELLPAVHEALRYYGNGVLYAYV